MQNNSHHCPWKPFEANKQKRKRLRFDLNLNMLTVTLYYSRFYPAVFGSLENVNKRANLFQGLENIKVQKESNPLQNYTSPALVSCLAEF